MTDQSENGTEKKQNKNSFADLYVRGPGLCILSLSLELSPVKRNWAI